MSRCTVHALCSPLLPIVIDQRPQGILLRLLLLSAATAVLGGCPQPIQYQPMTQVVVELGIPQARQRLAEVVSRSLNPRIIDMDVTEEFLRYRYPLDYPLGNPSGPTTAERRLVFQDIGQIDIYPNHLVFVWDSQRNIVAQFVFSSAQDAKTFADLVTSFRAYRSH